MHPSHLQSNCSELLISGFGLAPRLKRWGRRIDLMSPPAQSLLELSDALALHIIKLENVCRKCFLFLQSVRYVRIHNAIQVFKRFFPIQCVCSFA